MLLLAGTAAAQTFSVPFAPTGIAYDAGSQRVLISGNGSISSYTNGVLQWIWSATATDLAAGQTVIYNGVLGPTKTLWVLNGNGALQYNSNGLPVGGVNLTSGATALGSELTIGGTNYLLYATTNVYALNVANNVSTALFAVPAGFGVTGGDWCLRPNGHALADSLVALNSSTQVRLFYPDGVDFGSFNLGAYGVGTDVAFAGTNTMLAAQAVNTYISNIVYYNLTDYGLTIPAAVEPAVSVGGTNGPWQVVWAGRQLQAGTNLQDWQTLTNAPQPYPLAATNPAQFFRAVK